jgi:hypothetical protein
VLYNGSGGAVLNTDALSGLIPDQGGGFGVVTLSYPVNGIQNGSPDGVALVNGGAVIQLLSYEGTFVAVGGPANGLTSTDIGVGENGTEPLGQSLRLAGSGTTYEDFMWQTPAASSFGSVNAGQTFGVVVDEPVVISCGGPQTAAEGFEATRTITPPTPTTRSATITLDAVSPPSAGISLGPTTPAAGAGGTALATLTVGAATAAGLVHRRRDRRQR